MILSINNPYLPIPVPIKSKSARYLIAGKDGSTQLADLISHYLILKDYIVHQFASFDPEKSVTLCEIGVQSKNNISKIKFGIDVMLALDNTGLAYASLLSPSGTLILNDSVRNDESTRSKTHIILPSLKISKNIGERWNNSSELDPSKLTTACLFGGLMALEDEYLEPKLLHESLVGSGFDPVPPYAMAAYSAYDWIREHDLTGKSLIETVRWQISQVY